ncbi:MAG TPA: PadR family transcriptional regulator [Cyanobacteria bacterium UBA11049]|nr:PadR family transcriptional regulator [Cyanobacteria bacterium UBA11049]
MFDTKNQPVKSLTERSQLEELLMTTLLRQELYGLRMVQARLEASKRRRCLSIGSLYPTLHRLEKKGLIQSRWGGERLGERGSVRRRYDKLTQLGAIALD